MGFFDRLAGRAEQRNPEAVYAAAAEQLESKLRERRQQLVGLEAKQRTDTAGGDAARADRQRLIDELRQHIATLERQRRELDQERLTGPAAQALAEARVHAQDDASGLGERASSASLGAVRDHVDALNRRAHPGLLDADGVPIEGRRAAYGRKAAEDRARAELAALKAAMGKGPPRGSDEAGSDEDESDEEGCEEGGEDTL